MQAYTWHKCTSAAADSCIGIAFAWGKRATTLLYIAGGRDMLTTSRRRRSGDKTQPAGKIKTKPREANFPVVKATFSQQTVSLLVRWMVDAAQDTRIRQLVGSPLCFVVLLRHSLQCTLSLRPVFICSSNVSQQQRELLWRSFHGRLQPARGTHGRECACMCACVQHSKSPQLLCFCFHLIGF